MDTTPSSPEQDESDAYRGQSDWVDDLQSRISLIRNDRIPRSLAAEPWLDLWMQALPLTNKGSAISWDLSRSLKQSMSIQLNAAWAAPEAERDGALQRNFEAFFQELERAYLDGGVASALESIRLNLSTAQFYARYDNHTIQRVREMADELRSEMSALKAVEQDAAVVLSEARAASDRAVTAANTAEEAADAANVAAGQAGTTGLAGEFEKFAEDHKRASRWYRASTIIVLVSAVGTAVLFVLGVDRLILAAVGATTAEVSASQDPSALAAVEGQRWQAVVYRLAILGGLAGLSAYLGRQAALHRRLHDWGRAVEAQARSFEGFAKQITDPETKNQVQLLFSSRVLGSPPEPTAEKTAARDALQIVADAAMKNRGNV